jgi:hypothetical protein
MTQSRTAQTRPTASLTSPVFSVPAVAKREPGRTMPAAKSALRPGFRKLLTNSAEVAQKLRFIAGQP